MMLEPTRFKVSEQNESIIITLNRKYEINKDNEYYNTIGILIDMINEKNGKKIFHEALMINYFCTIEFKLGKHKMDEEKCMICLTEFEIIDVEKEVSNESDDDIYTLPCSHIFHKCCLNNMIGGNEWVKCPICSTIFGIMKGDMPEEGRMDVTFDKNFACSGYNKGTILIHYRFKGCNRNGVHVPGISRYAYLPDTPEGKEVLELLKICWNRKLTFTVGRSVTTGLDNQIVWNGIHHKTSPDGGAANFGYPDPTYLKRVKEELGAKGIIGCTIKK